MKEIANNSNTKGTEEYNSGKKILARQSESDISITQEIEEGVKDSVKTYFRIGKDKLDNSDGGKFVQFQSMVRFLLSVICCLLYVVQTVFLPHEHFSLPQHCCPLIHSRGEHCSINGFENDTLGGQFAIMGCDLVTKVSGYNRQSLNKTLNVNLYDKLPLKSCHNFCKNRSNNTCEIENNICDCAIACKENLYCAVQKENTPNVHSKFCFWTGLNYYRLLYLDRPLWLYIIQSTISVLLMANAIILTITHWRRGTRLLKLIDTYLIIDCFNGTLFLISFAYAPCLRDLYVPIFLQCFTASIILKRALFSFDVSISENKYFTPVVQTITGLAFRLLSVLFIFICIIQYLERIECPGDGRINTLFDAFWFVIVTITTVGYGDISPTTPLGKISTVILILLIILILPNILAEVVELITDSRKNYRFYTGTNRNKHVVLVVSKLEITSLNDYLEEFYAQEENENLITVILTFKNISSLVKVRLSCPALKKKVVIIVGSALLRRDLYRVKLNLAKACIVLSNRATDDQKATDQETILRATAIRAYAPNVQLYVHILRLENIINVKFATQIVCEGEFKNLIIANNCLYPGLSSFIALLTHTTQPKISSNKEWMQLYEYCCGHEIYDIKLKDSQLFRAFEGKNFIFAAIVRLRSKGVLLFAVQPANEKHILLNPGKQYILKKEDTLFYIAQDQEIVRTKKDCENNVKSGKRSHRDEERNINSDICAQIIEDEIQFGNSRERHDSIMATIMENVGEDNVESEDDEIFNSLRNETTTKDNTSSTLKEQSNERRERLLSMKCSKSGETFEEAVEHPQSRSRNSSLSLKSLRKHSSPSEKVDAETFNVRGRQRARPLLRRLATLDFGKDEKSSNYEVRKSSIVGELENTMGIAEAKGIKELDNQQSMEKIEIIPNIVFNNDDKETILGVHPSPLYAGHDAVCRLNRYPLNLCCLQAGWKMHCHEDEHGIYSIKRLFMPEEPMRFLYPIPYKNFLIVCAQEADVQILQFILPMRTYNIEPIDMIPIILLLNETPNSPFLEAISWFPKIRFIQGSMESIDDMVIAGAYEARGVVMLMTESSDDVEEVHMTDAKRLSCAEKMSKLFAHATFYVELTERWSMRLLKLQNGQMSSTKLPINNLHNYIRTPHFMSSQGFTPSMLDSLLHQSIQKPYIIDLVRLLLGQEQTAGSGYLAQVELGNDVNPDDTYGKLIVKLALRGDLPIAIYRKHAQNSDAWSKFKTEHDTRTIPFLDRKIASINKTWQVQKLNSLMIRTYVLVNPPATTPIKSGDIILVIRVCTEAHYNTLEKYKKMQINRPSPMKTLDNNIDEYSDENSDGNNPQNKVFKNKSSMIDAIMKRNKAAYDPNENINRLLVANRVNRIDELKLQSSNSFNNSKSESMNENDDNDDNDDNIQSYNSFNANQHGLKVRRGSTHAKYKTKQRKKQNIKSGSFLNKLNGKNYASDNSNEYKKKQTEVKKYNPRKARYTAPNSMLLKSKSESHATNYQLNNDNNEEISVPRSLPQGSLLQLPSEPNFTN